MERNYFVVEVYVDYDERMTIENGGVVTSDDYNDAVELLKVRYDLVKDRLSNAKIVLGVIKQYEGTDNLYENDKLLYSELINLKNGHSIRM